MKIVNIDGGNHLLNGLLNLNEIFRKDVAYKNIESHKKSRPLIKSHNLN